MKSKQAYEELGNAIVLQAVKDYRYAIRKLRIRPKDIEANRMKKEIISFFNSQWFMILTSVDGELLLKRLNSEVR